MAVLDRAARASGARLAAVEARGDLRMDSRSRPKKNVEVEGQCGDADGAARRARLRRRALLGREWSPRSRYRVRHEPDARWPPSRDQAAQCLEVRIVLF